MKAINDPKRLADIKSYDILDTPSEKDLDDLNELASIICDTNISLISIIDNHRQWYKSKKGLEVSQIAVEDSFCQYTLDRPNDILEIADALQDPRFKDHAFVTEDPNIRFYASIPLVSKNHNVIGTLCVADSKAKTLNTDQRKALSILANMTMAKIELRKLIRSQSSAINFNTQRLIKITENAPAAIFEMKLKMGKYHKFTFISRGVKYLYPEISYKQWLLASQDTLNQVMGEDHESFIAEVNHRIKKGKTNPFRIDFSTQNNDKVYWHSLQGKLERNNEDEWTLFGSIQDVSKHYDFKDAMDQILFDISHVVRRPVTTILSLLDYIETHDEDPSKDKVKEYLDQIKSVNLDLNNYTKQLNQHYQKRKDEIFSLN